MAKVRISGTNVELDVAPGQNLLAALQRAGHPIATSCGGRASCGLCRITVIEGRSLLSPIGADELGHLGNVAKIIGMRLACQSVIAADESQQSHDEVLIDVPVVDDVESRKRAKAERLQRERLVQRRASQEPQPGAEQKVRAKTPRTEWRPRKLGASDKGSAGELAANSLGFFSSA